MSRIDFAREHDEAFRAVRAEAVGLLERDPARVIVLSDLAGKRFRVSCTACALPLRWYPDRAAERWRELHAGTHEPLGLDAARLIAGAEVASTLGKAVPNAERQASYRARIGEEVRVCSATRPGIEYRVLLAIDGRGVCTCAGWEFRAECWHAKAVEEGSPMTTTDTQALVPLKVEPPRSILPSQQELSIIKVLAQTAVQARGHAVPASIDSPAKAAAIMLAGHELGLKPMTALRHVFVVNGRTEPDAQAMAGIVTAREPDATFEIVELTAERCTMRLRRQQRELVAEYTYEIEDSRKANLIKGGNTPWSLFPKDMLRWAATKRLCRAYAPDLVNSGARSRSRPSARSSRRSRTGPVTLEGVPSDQLYNAGDEPQAPDVPELSGAADVEEDEAAATFEDNMPRTVREYLAWARERYELAVEELYAVHGTDSVAELQRRGLGTLIAEVSEYARRVRKSGA